MIMIAVQSVSTRLEVTRFPRIYVSVLHPIVRESSGDGVLEYVFTRDVLHFGQF